ncbi:hypothetical protein V6N12_065792 [Hibiscus sabdariffa]|uniref:Uncharacterized protein n=1 Tax=Hibiscus sabdariffa TaxID=183260 RepID=A0ABR2G9W0_9ROSI
MAMGSPLTLSPLQYGLWLGGCSGEYSDPIVIPVEFPSLPRPRISADIFFSAEMSFLLVSRSFQSELLQYNFLHQDPAAFGFCQGRSVPGRFPEITNKLATVSFYHKICNI